MTLLRNDVDLYREQSLLGFAYSEVGATRSSDSLPDGYHHQSLNVVIGSGRATFDRVAEHITTFGAQRSLGLRIFPASQRALEGATVVMSSPLLRVATRVVFVDDSPTRKGFSYGTLPHHPEVGEEYFGVTIDEHGVVRAEIRAFSRPGNLFVRLVRPLALLAQQLATHRYISSMRRVAKG